MAEKEDPNAADSMSSNAVQPNARDAGTESDPSLRNVPRRNAVAARPEPAEKAPVSANGDDDVKVKLVDKAADGTSGSERLISEGATCSEGATSLEKSQSASD
jgi:hypothetical protein